MALLDHEGTRIAKSKHAEALPLFVARKTFAWLVAEPNPLSLDGRLFPGLPDRVVSLGEVRDVLLERTCSPVTRDAVWVHLVLRSRMEGATWTVACVGMALPALAATAGWLAARYRGDVFDVHAAVLAAFAEALATIDLRAPGVLTRLRWTARRKGQEAMEESLNAPTPTAPGFWSTPPRSPWAHPDLVLARAVTDGVLSETDADLIGTTRLEDVPIADWAKAHGRALEAVYKRRERAEHRLVAYICEASQDVDTEDPTSLTVVADRKLSSVGGPESSSGRSQMVAGRQSHAGTKKAKNLGRSCRKCHPKPVFSSAGEMCPHSRETTQPTRSTEVRNATDIPLTSRPFRWPAGGQ